MGNKINRKSYNSEVEMKQALSGQIRAHAVGRHSRHLRLFYKIGDYFCILATKSGPAIIFYFQQCLYKV
jgi:hypothetical protein